MAALAANTTIIQILKDTPTEVVARLFLHQDTAGDESSVLKINCETLAYRTFVLTQNNSSRPLPNLWPGEKLVGNTSGAIGYVVEQPAANQILITNVTGTFTNTEIVYGTRFSPNVAIQLSANTITPARLLSIKSASWCVTSNNQQTEAKVGLEFANATVFFTALMVNETGEFGEGYSGWAKTKIAPPSTLTSPNGNLYVSTYSVSGKGGYHIFVELRKEQGFAAGPVQ
jgi:hypothetical protein